MMLRDPDQDGDNEEIGMRSLAGRTLLLGALLALLLPARGLAQTTMYCVTPWTNTCASVNATTYFDTDAGIWRVRLTVRNISLAGGEGDNSVLTRLLVRVYDENDNALFGSGMSVTGDGSAWDGWELGERSNAQGPREFNMIGQSWTNEINNMFNNPGGADQGSCVGVITGSAFDLPCDGGADHRLVGVFTIDYGDVRPVFVDWSAQMQQIASPTCPADEPYCESGWAAVPEPFTMVLVGTGLAGIGGAALRRRRRGLDIQDE